MHDKLLFLVFKPAGSWTWTNLHSGKFSSKSICCSTSFVGASADSSVGKQISLCRCGVLVGVRIKFASDKKGNKQLIVRCKNAIYGTMVASLLYYRKFSKSLLDNGFEFNPYDPCVANKMVDAIR
jgi:hypothetical protein